MLLTKACYLETAEFFLPLDISEKLKTQACHVPGIHTMWCCMPGSWQDERKRDGGWKYRWMWVKVMPGRTIFFFLLFLEKPEQAHWAGSGSSLLLLMVLCFAHWKSGQFEGNSMSVLQKIFVSLFSSLKLYWRLTVCGNWIIPLLFGRIRLRGPALALICWSLTLLVCHLYTSCCSAGMFISPREFLILCQTLLDHKGNII